MQCLATGALFRCLHLASAQLNLLPQHGRLRPHSHPVQLPIGAFEGIEEALARMAGTTYLMDAARQVTCAALDDGQNRRDFGYFEIPLNRRHASHINDGMDIQGGSGICLGRPILSAACTKLFQLLLLWKARIF